MIPVTETSLHGHRRNGATGCPVYKIAPTRSSFVRLSVKSGRFVCSGQINNAQELARTPIARAIIWTRVTNQFESRENRHIRISMEGKGVDILHTALMERNAYRSIHITGKVPRQTAPKSPAAENIAQITKEVLEQLTRLAEAA